MFHCDDLFVSERWLGPSKRAAGLFLLSIPRCSLACRVHSLHGSAVASVKEVAKTDHNRLHISFCDAKSVLGSGKTLAVILEALKPVPPSQLCKINRRRNTARKQRDFHRVNGQRRAEENFYEPGQRFDERNEAVKRMIEQLIKTAHKANCKVGICGAERLSRVRGLPCRVRHRLDLDQSRSLSRNKKTGRQGRAPLPSLTQSHAVSRTQGMPLA